MVGANTDHKVGLTFSVQLVQGINISAQVTRNKTCITGASLRSFVDASLMNVSVTFSQLCDNNTRAICLFLLQSYNNDWVST